MLTSEFAREAAPGTAYENVVGYWNHSSGEMLQRLLYTDIKTYLVELLMKQDNMSMAASIESRVPFLDHVLVEFATRIPREVQIQGLAGKRILKKAVEDLLPHSILYRPSWDFQRRGADGWPDRGWKQFARPCSSRAASSADTSGAKPSRNCSPNIAPSIATTTIVSGGCLIWSCGTVFVLRANRTTRCARPDNGHDSRRWN